METISLEMDKCKVSKGAKIRNRYNQVRGFGIRDISLIKLELGIIYFTYHIVKLTLVHVIYSEKQLKDI